MHLRISVYFHQIVAACSVQNQVMYFQYVYHCVFSLAITQIPGLTSVNKIFSRQDILHFFSCRSIQRLQICKIPHRPDRHFNQQHRQWYRPRTRSIKTVFEWCVFYVRMLNTCQWTSLRVLSTPYVHVGRKTAALEINPFNKAFN